MKILHKSTNTYTTIALNFLREQLMWNIAFKIKAIETALNRFMTSFTHAFSTHSFASIGILIMSASNQLNFSFVLRETDEFGCEKNFSGFREKNSKNSRKGEHMNGIRQLMELWSYFSESFFFFSK